MIKKKKNKNLVKVKLLIILKSFLKKNKIVIYKKKLKQNNVLINKKFFNKNFIYKNYKFLNLKKIYKSKRLYINFYKYFFDVFALLIFLNSKLIFKRNFFINSKKIKNKKIKNKIKYNKNILLLKNQQSIYLKYIFDYLYMLSLQNYMNLIKYLYFKENINIKKQNMFTSLKLTNDIFYKVQIFKNFVFLWNNVYADYIYNNKNISIFHKNKKEILYKILNSLEFYKKDNSFLQIKNLMINLRKNKNNLNYKNKNNLNYIKEKNFNYLNKYLKGYNIKKKDRKFLKKFFFKNNIFKIKKKKNVLLKKNIYYSIKQFKKLKWKKKLIKKRLNFYKNKLFLNKKKTFNIISKETKQRFFFYDFFFSKYNKDLFIIKHTTKINILWKNKINKTFARFRLSEYIFLLLNSFNNTKFFIENKFYYIINFYKIVILLKKNLLNIKKLLIKKPIFNSFLNNNKKFINLKKIIKKEYIINKNMNNNVLYLKYLTLLKYFNKFFFFYYNNIYNNVKKLVNKYRPFIYLSFMLNLAIDKKKYISLVSMNHYFMQKVNKSFVSSWILNDNVLNYLDILDTAFKKKFYWNFFSPIYNLSKKNKVSSYFMEYSIAKNINRFNIYFISKNKNSYLLNKYNNKFKIYNILYLYILLLYFIKKKKLEYFKFINNKFINNLKNNNILLNKNELKYYYFLKIFLKKKINILYNINYLKKNIYVIIFFQLKKYNLQLKKKYFIKLINLLNILVLKQRYFSLGLNNLNFFLFILYTKMLNYFTSFNQNNFFELNKKNILKNQLYFKMFGGLKKNKYIFKKFFLNIVHNYYTSYSKKNKMNYKKCILHFIEKKSNNFLVLSLFHEKRVIGHTSGGQGLNRAYVNSKRQKKGTRILTKIIFRKLRLRARKYALKEVYIKANNYWNFRINLLTKFWVLRYKLGVPYFKGLKVATGLSYHKGLRLPKKKRK